MIKVTYADILNADKPLTKITELAAQGKVSFGLGYKVGRIVKKINAEIGEFFKEQEALLKKYGEQKEEIEKDKDGKTIYEKDENGKVKKDKKGKPIPKKVKTDKWNFENDEARETYNQEIAEILKTEIELVGVFKIKKEEFGELALDIESIMLLEPFILDEEAEAEERKPSP